MKFFVTGVNGQLGHDVMNELHKRGHQGVGSDLVQAYAGVADESAVTTVPYVSLDITDKEAVRKSITEIKPDAVIHCAAWTAVDMAKDDDKVEKVRAVNAGGTQNIAEACKAMDCKITFQIARRILDKLNAQCLISGAFGVFRKSVLLQMNGYDTDTVGEDMELVLRLLDGGYQKAGNQIVYDPTAVCYTRVPHRFKRFLRQRDRWQRGCLHVFITGARLYGIATFSRRKLVW